MDNIVIASPDTATLESQAAVFIEKAEGLVIVTADDHAIALVTIKGLRNQEKSIKAHFEPARKATDDAKKQVLHARDSLIKPIAEARGILSDKAVAYSDEQERIRAEQQRIIDEAAKKEQDRIDAEAKAAEEKRLAELETAIEEDDVEKAEEILEADPEPVEEVVPEKVEPEVAEVPGTSTRTTWSAEVVDKKALIEFVAGCKGFDHVLEPCMKELNKYAVKMKESLNIPGVQGVSKTTVVTR